VRPALRPLPVLAATSVAVLLTAGAVTGLAVSGATPWVRAAGPAHPPLPPDAADAPLATPAPPPPGEGGFAVLDRQPTADGEPVGWDRCRPVHYVVDARSAPPGGEYLLAGALAELTRVTGLVFVDDGATDEPVTDDRPAVQVDRYGDRWAPVLVAWSDPAAAPRLAGDVAAYAGPQAVDGATAGSRRYVTGQLVLDAPQVAAMASAEAGLARARAVVLHELGHLVGLDHVDDPSQLMYPSTTPLVVDFADGDLRGLAAVSAGPCHTDF
jgi:hypothetical protein